MEGIRKLAVQLDGEWYRFVTDESEPVVIAAARSIERELQELRAHQGAVSEQERYQFLILLLLRSKLAHATDRTHCALLAEQIAAVLPAP